MPKNIVLLSDGTGNSAAKAHRTNVWSLYRTLDLTQDDQIALYDDGVGSQEFLPFRILGGVFGWGLKRNVLELFSFLCQNYEEGDRIYLFGFSRGAFTVRVLAGLICHQGLRQGLSRQELDREVKKAYKAYRKDRFPWGPKNFLKQLLGNQKTPLLKAAQAPDINAIGVWDTVDAYGMPIDELTLAWDYFIQTLRFADLNLPPNVIEAYHALAIDDERQTFHPTLWNEEGEPPGKIEQVWFSGAHSNVGGGYPKDELALVALDWMMSNVEKLEDGSQQNHQVGLRFIQEERQRIKDLGYVHGHLYNARSGLGAYYRFKPRNIEKLSHDMDKGVEIASPKIHDSVLQRIQQQVVPYAPVGIPQKYEVVPSQQVYENPQQAQNRVNCMEKAWDVIGWRRILYFAFVASSLLLVASKAFLKWEPGGPCEGVFCVFDPILNIFIKVIPDFAAGWIEALRQNPKWLIGFLMSFGILSLIKKWWFRKTAMLSAEAWKEVKEEKVEEPESLVDLPSTLTYKVRTNPILTFLYQGFAKKALPMACMMVMVIVPILLMSRFAFELRTTAGGICETPAEVSTLKPGESHSIEFATNSPCSSTGIAIKKGGQYKVTVEVDGEETWMDGDNIVANPNGFVNMWDSVKLALAVPTRRSWSAPWFSLLGRVGTEGKDRFEIGEGHMFTGKTDGPLFLFVNDAVCGFCLGKYATWPYFWVLGENEGTANVTITRLPTGTPLGVESIFATSKDGRM